MKCLEKTAPAAMRRPTAWPGTFSATWPTRRWKRGRRARATGWQKFVKRNKGQVVAASLVLLAPLGGVVGTTLGLLEATAAAAKERTANASAQAARTAAENAEAKERAAKIAAQESATKEKRRRPRRRRPRNGKRPSAARPRRPATAPAPCWTPWSRKSPAIRWPRRR